MCLLRISLFYCEQCVVLPIALLFLIRDVSLLPHPTTLRVLLSFLFTYCFSFFSLCGGSSFLFMCLMIGGLCLQVTTPCVLHPKLIHPCPCVFPFLGLGFALLLDCLDSIPFLLMGLSRWVHGDYCCPPQDFLY